MQALLPPMKVILRGHKQINIDVGGKEKVMMLAHMCEYTPGTCASSNARGSGSSQRSGRHSWASGHRRVVSQFAAPTSGMISVPLGRWTTLDIVPSRMRIGSESGRTTSFVVLW